MSFENAKILTKIFAPVWDVCFCHEVAKILPKFLPQFKISDPDLKNLRGSCPTVNARKMLRVLFSQCCFKTTKFTLLLLFSKASKLGFDSLCLCRINVLSENVLISNIKSLTMPIKQKLPQFSKLRQCWVLSLFSKAGL
jgi:hypothetical protein